MSLPLSETPSQWRYARAIFYVLGPRRINTLQRRNYRIAEYVTDPYFSD